MTARRLFGGAENVLARMNRLVMSGMYAPPVWYHAVRRVPPLVQLAQPHPGQISFPEDRLYPSLYRRIPSLQDEPLLVTDASQQTVGNRMARRWWSEIEATEGRDEEVAWQRLMADPEVQGWLHAYEQRAQEAADHPITAGNVSRHVEAKMRAMHLLRSLPYPAPPEQRRVEIQRGLDALEANQRQAGEHRPVVEDDDGLTPERRDLLPSGRQWLVPDMSEAHQLRFVVAPPNYALNEVYNQSAGRASPPKRDSPVVEEASADTNSLHWAMSKAVVQEGATMRDWIAYALRLQVLVLKRFELVQWLPYTLTIDPALWRQARVVLRCRRVEALDGVEVEEKRRTMGGEQWTSTAGIRNERPLVHHHLQPPLNVDDQRKHALVSHHSTRSHLYLPHHCACASLLLCYAVCARVP